MKAGIPQGSIVGPQLFSIYMNDISESLVCELKLFTDDTTLSSVNNLLKACNLSTISK